MSVGDLLRASSAGLIAILKAALGWLFIAPCAWIVPRRRDWLAVIGREDGKFLDNAKYFFLQATGHAPDVRIVFVTERQDVAAMLADARMDAVVFPSWRGAWFLMRAGTVVIDSYEWFRRCRRFVVAGAKRVQLWHGVGFKRIELDKWRNEVDAHSILSSPLVLFLRKAFHAFTGRLVRYDLVNTTSEFYRDRVFAQAFLSRHFIVTGYPRNIFGAVDGAGKVLAWRNVDVSIAGSIDAWLSAGRRIVLVTPTFRDSRSSPMGLDPETVAMLDAFCEVHRIELVFKFHPFERQAGDVKGRHLHLCDPDSDVYPLMPFSSALITDYSSIYMDYLLLDRPVLFLVPDLDDYVRRDRQFQFDFHEMTPGPRCASWKNVVTQLSQQCESDAYAEARARLKRLAFDDLPQIESVPKLVAFMRKRGWLR